MNTSSFLQQALPYLDWLWDERCGHTAVLHGIALRICAKQHTANLPISHLVLSQSALLKSLWCNYKIVLTKLLLEKICFILSERSDFHVIDNLSIADPTPMCIGLITMSNKFSCQSKNESISKVFLCNRWINYNHFLQISCFNEDSSYIQMWKTGSTNTDKGFHDILFFTEKNNFE